MRLKFSGLQGYAMILMLTVAGPLSAAEVMENESILDVIHGMRQVAMERAAVEALFDAQIAEVKGNGYWTYHEGAGNIFEYGSKIRKFGFMTKNDGTGTPVVYADLSGHCVSFAQVKYRYPDMVSRGNAPSPHSSNPTVGYVYLNEEGQMSFSFTIDKHFNPACLVNVGFSPARTFRSPPS